MEKNDDPRLRAIKRAIVRHIQFKNFGRFLENGDFLSTRGEVDQLNKSCEDAARDVLGILEAGPPANFDIQSEARVGAETVTAFADVAMTRGWLESALRRAYEAGAMDVRERAAKEAEDRQWALGRTTATVIRALPLTESKS